MFRRVLLVLIIVSAANGSPAAAATQVGVRGGWAHATGDVFQGSGGIGGDGVYGFIASVGLLPMIDLEFAYERYTTDFSFSDAAYNSVFFDGKGDFKDQAYLLTGKAHLPLIGGPFSFYGGGGGSLHRIDLKVHPDEGTPDSLEIEDHFSDERNEWEWHLVGGVDFKLPILPLLVYAEYRYQDVTGKHNPSYSTVYGGLNLYLK
jgi:hypothetical protein